MKSRHINPHGEKDYKVLNLKTLQISVSIDVTFYEEIFFLLLLLPPLSLVLFFLHQFSLHLFLPPLINHLPLTTFHHLHHKPNLHLHLSLYVFPSLPLLAVHMWSLSLLILLLMSLLMFLSLILSL